MIQYRVMLKIHARLIKLIRVKKTRVCTLGFSTRKLL